MTTENQNPSYENIVFPEGDSQKCESPEKCVCDNRKKAALEEAHKIRQFEITLYWQRSLYFWGFQAAFFAAYALILGNSDEKDELLVYGAMAIIAVLGFFVSVLWHYLAKGSKAWQENWENHINLLEDKFTGRLYKTVLGDEKDFYSVTRINQLIIFAIRWAWALLFVLPFISLCKKCLSCITSPMVFFSSPYCLAALVILLITLIMMLYFWHKNKNAKKDDDSIFRIKSRFPSQDYCAGKISAGVLVYKRWKGCCEEKCCGQKKKCIKQISIF